MLPGFGFMLLFFLPLGVILANFQKEDQVKLNFDASLFSCALLPPIVFSAGMLLDFNHFVSNWRTIVFRGLFIPFTSFVLVSTGALFCFPILGIQSITARDCLVIGSLFASTNFLFSFEDIREGRENMRHLYEISIGESIFNTATSFMLYKIVHNMDLMMLQPSHIIYLVAQFAYVVVASILLGFAVGIYVKYFVAYLILWKNPEFDIDAEGSLRMELKFHVTVVHAFLLGSSFLVYLLAEVLKLNHELVIFLYALLTSHHLLPKPEGFRITIRYAVPMIVNYIEAPMYLFFSGCISNSHHWGYVFRSPATFGMYLAATLILFILLILGRVPSMLHFSQNVMTKVENVGELRNAYLLNRWPITNIELENKVIIWWSGFMPSLFAVALAIEQFDKSEEFGHGLMLTSVCSVVYLSSLVYFIFMASPLKQWLVKLMITSRDTGKSPPRDTGKSPPRP